LIGWNGHDRDMFAVIKTGGKQYRVAASDVIEVGKLDGAHGDSVAFDQVLMVGGESGVAVGSPLVTGAAVAGEIVDQGRDRKILVFKKRRRQNSKRSRGHRQHFTVVRITEILTDGKAPSRAAAAEAPITAEAPAAKAKRAAKPKTETAAGETPAEAAKPARKPRAKAAPKADSEE
jgi:large subunit ribosomal protein L21